MRRRVSIKDIAEVAGVSAPTVSRALQQRGRMSETTRAHIIAVAEELGYTPSLVARGLVTQRSFAVGLVITSFIDPFHSEIAQSIEEEAARNGYHIFLAGASDDPDQELRVVHSLLGRQVDGIIISSSRVGNRYAELLQGSGIPLVLINTQVEGEHIHSIYHDDYAGSQLVIEHLLERGYRRILYVGNRQGERTNQARQQAWLDTLQAAGIVQSFPPCDSATGNIQGGVAAATDLLTWRQAAWGLPDALAFYNDSMAIGAISVLSEQGLQIPGDIAVAGFDDIDVAAYTIPALTTVHQPRRAMGIRAIQTLLALIRQEMPANAPQITKMLGELIVRKST